MPLRPRAQAFSRWMLGPVAAARCGLRRKSHTDPPPRRTIFVGDSGQSMPGSFLPGGQLWWLAASDSESI